MASRRGASSFARSARSAFHTFRPSAPSSSSAAPRRVRNPFENGSPSTQRRRMAQTMIPLHSVAASAKLVSHLSVSSRSCQALASGLQGYFFSSYQLMPAAQCSRHMEYPEFKPIPCQLNVLEVYQDFLERTGSVVGAVKDQD